MITIRNTPPPGRNGATLIKSAGTKLHKRLVNPHARPNEKPKQGIEKHNNSATGLCSPMGKKISRPLLEEKARRLYERGRAACRAGLHEDAESYFLASLDYWERLGSGPHPHERRRTPDSPGAEPAFGDTRATPAGTACRAVGGP